MFILWLCHVLSSLSLKVKTLHGLEYELSATFCSWTMSTRPSLNHFLGHFNILFYIIVGHTPELGTHPPRVRGLQDQKHFCHPQKDMKHPMTEQLCIL